MGKKRNSFLYIFIAVCVATLGAFLLFGCSEHNSGKETTNNDNDITESSGQKINYIDISTAEELQGLANKDGDFRLINDINIGGNEWTPIENFSGVLEGNGKTISGLTISGNKENIGLFATLKGTVKNLNITGINITGTGNAGIVGSVCGTNEGIILNVTTQGIINASFYNNVGGIAGKSDNCHISNCTNLVSVTGYDNVGGIVGYLNPEMFSSFDSNTNDGIINGVNCVGGLVGNMLNKCSDTKNGEITFTNNRNNKEVSGSGNKIGGLIGYQSSDGFHPWGTTYYTYLNISSSSNTGMVNGKEYVGGIIGFGEYTLSIAFVNNTSNIYGVNYVGGYVGKAEKAEIKDAVNNMTIKGKGYIGGIAGYAKSINNCTNNGDIISTGVIIEQSSNCSYVGGIAGYANIVNNCNNKSNISVLTGGQYVAGIVGYLLPSSGDTIDNNINEGVINGTSCVGGIAGCLINKHSNKTEIIFSGNENHNSISGSGDYVGGLIGCEKREDELEYCPFLNVYNCSNAGTINGKNYIGGIIGMGEGITDISSSQNSADVTGANYVGGYVGRATNAEIKIATNNTTITGKGYVGGIAGYAKSINNCTNNGEVDSVAIIMDGASACAYVGGIAGYAITVNECTNNADINVTTGGRYVAGIVGFLKPNSGNTIELNVNNGEIRGNSYVGGIIGCVCNAYAYNGEVSFSNNSNQKTIVGNGDYIGGLIGYQSCEKKEDYSTKLKISNCNNFGKIKGKNYVAGIMGIGEYTSLISMTSNTAIIIGDNYVGGCVGKTERAEIKSSNNTMDITGKGYVGGIAGYTKSLDYCINDGTVYSSDGIVEDSSMCAYAGGIAGFAKEVNNCSNNANVTADTGIFVAGIVAYLNPSKASLIENNVNDGNIMGTSYVGGIAGCLRNDGPNSYEQGIMVYFSNNRNQADVAGQENYVGGVIGYQSSNTSRIYSKDYYTYLNISNCKNDAAVIGNDYVAGIVGYGEYIVQDEQLLSTNINSGTIHGIIYDEKYGYLR